ncbi:MAG: metal-binding protein [Bacteroidetes bacterium]|nr:MAG: metal-binding protein [Bacteroidota bacterium]
MIKHCEITTSDLHQNIRQKKIIYGGNSKFLIYGTLQCKSGKRMNKGNRVFFHSIDQATSQGYRPCGNCLGPDYKKWKHGLV